jgi:hypothetical protein
MFVGPPAVTARMLMCLTGEERAVWMVLGLHEP